MRSRYVMAGHVKTHYVEAGDNGPVVVLLHGGGPGSSGEAGFGRLIPPSRPGAQAVHGGQSYYRQRDGFADAAERRSKALNSYDGSEQSMRRVMETLTYDKSVITPELIAIRNAAANRPGAARAREIANQGQRRLASDPNLRLKYDMRHTLPQLTIPAMFVWGENDTFAPLELGRELEILLPNVPFHVIPNAGHQAQTDQPEIVAKLMIQHFTS